MSLRAPCSAQECDRPRYTRRSEYCRMHYMRVWRHGTLVPKIIRGERPKCGLDECEERTDTPGVPYCMKHQQRYRKHGDARVNGRLGPASPLWKGDAAGYQAAHRRVHVRRGPAITHTCVDCGLPAAQWSYDHTDPEEKVCPEDGPYSFDVARYQPRCVSCHTRLDKGLSRPLRP